VLDRLEQLLDYRRGEGGKLTWSCSSDDTYPLTRQAILDVAPGLTIRDLLGDDGHACCDCEILMNHDSRPEGDRPGAD
jgi:hypothetical protein